MIMQLPYLGLSVGHRHLCNGGTVEDGPEAALVLVGDVVDDEALAPGESDADVPPLPLDQVALHLRKPACLSLLCKDLQEACKIDHGAEPISVPAESV